MTDFWFSALWTALIASINFLSDFVIARIVVQARFISAIGASIEKARTSGDDTTLDVEEALLDMRRNARAAGVFGSDLAAIALALDLAALGVWISDNDSFTFFTSFNSVTEQRETAVWFALIGAHFVAFLAAMICKHMYSTSDQATGSGSSLRSPWLWIGNLIGLSTLLSSFLILTDSV